MVLLLIVSVYSVNIDACLEAIAAEDDVTYSINLSSDNVFYADGKTRSPYGITQLSGTITVPVSNNNIPIELVKFQNNSDKVDNTVSYDSIKTSPSLSISEIFCNGFTIKSHSPESLSKISFTPSMNGTEKKVSFSGKLDNVVLDLDAITDINVDYTPKSYPRGTKWDTILNAIKNIKVTGSTTDGESVNLSVSWDEDKFAENEYISLSDVDDYPYPITVEGSIINDKYDIACDEPEIEITINKSSTETLIKNYNNITMVVDSSSDPEIDDDLEDMAIADKRKILLGVYSNSSAAVKEAISDAVALEEEISFSVSAKKKSSVKSKEKEKIAKEAEDGASGATVNYYYFDLTVTLSIAGEKIGTIENTGSDISFELYVPSSITKKTGSSSTASTRNYKVVRYHDDSADSMTDYDDDDPIEFDSHKFSTYAIAYYDKTSSASNTSSSINSRSASVKDTLDTTSGNNASGKSPKTGDDFNPRIWIYLLIVAATIATCAGVLLHDTKDTDEAERK